MKHFALTNIAVCIQVRLGSSPEKNPEIDNDLFQLKLNTWMFNNKYPIAYEVACYNKDIMIKNNVVPILLLNGFGVGSFHQHRLMNQLLLQHQSTTLSSNLQYRIYAIDYLGQGKSWPANCDDGMSEDEYNLGYSADMWIDQLTNFIVQVIIGDTSEKVHIVGNSVGGYLGTILSYRHPHLVSTLTMLNGTPLWGLNLPMWDGKLPAPPIPKAIGRVMFDAIRNPDIVEKYLEVAYVHKEAFDGTHDDSFGFKANSDPLNRKIRACTEGKGGHAAFASILWSSPASSTSEDGNKMGFYDVLQKLPVDVLLLFGSDDEWCTPSVAKRMHTTLSERSITSDGCSPCQRYVTIDNAGHCPNHEAPTAVASVLISWLAASDRSEALLVSDEIVQEPWGKVQLREVTIEESKSSSFVDKVIASMVG